MLSALLLSSLLGGPSGYSPPVPPTGRGRTTLPRGGASLGTNKRPPVTTLRAGLRDLVGPYGDEDDGRYPPSSLDTGASGTGRRRSPGFVGFGRDDGGGPGGGRGGGGYADGGADPGLPPYDVVIDTAGRPTRDVYDDFGGGTRRIPRDKYVGRPSSDFASTNGAGGGRGGGRGTRSVSRPYDGPPASPRPALPPGLAYDGYDSLSVRGASSSANPVELFYRAWNARNVALALSCFDDRVYYDDTSFSEPFDGKDKLANHLLYVVDCVPDSFYLVVDELSEGRSLGAGRNGDGPNSPFGGRDDRRRRVPYDRPTINVAALWHIENDSGPLPLARGTSFFKVDPATNLIVEAYEFSESGLKSGTSGLNLLSIVSKLLEDNRRWFPFWAWAFYTYFVFFSQGVLPGKDLLHADAKTWAEVRDLSSSFLFLAPALKLPTAAKLHPVLEGLFNGVLAWSFLFAGFLSDERSGVGPYGRDARYYERMVRNQEELLDSGVVLVPPVSTTKSNLLPLVPTIVGMQFFACAFLLPYLFSRTNERPPADVSLYDGPRRIRPLYKEELDRPAAVLGEWRGLGIVLGCLGLYSLYWGFAGRAGADFGPPIWVSDKRMLDFMKILDKDRVAASLVINLWVLGIFQGWLIDDDWKRRGRSLEEETFLRNVAKFFPFFGLAAYLIFRPRFPSDRGSFDYDDFELERERGRRRRDGRF